LRELSVNEIRVPKRRLRSEFDEESARGFESSVGQEGVRVPIHVVVDEKGVFWLEDGGNRLQAAKKRRQPKILAFVRPGSELDAIYGSSINVLRGEVNLAELACFCRYLHDEHGLSEAEISNHIGRSKSMVSKLLTISSEPLVLERLRRGELGLEEAYQEARGFVTKPLTPEDLERRKSKSPRPCDLCGRLMTRDEFSYIIVHEGACSERVWELIQRLREELEGGDV